MDSPREKRATIFLPVIVVLAYLLWVPCSGAADSVSLNQGTQPSSDIVHKERGMRLADLPAMDRERISQHLRKADYEVSRCETTLPSGTTSLYRASNRNQDLSAYFTGHGVHLLPHGRGEQAWHLEMTLSGYGYEGAMEKAQHVQSAQTHWDRRLSPKAAH